jgi:hypothetical protein
MIGNPSRDFLHPGTKRSRRFTADLFYHTGAEILIAKQKSTRNLGLRSDVFPSIRESLKQVDASDAAERVSRESYLQKHINNFHFIAKPNILQHGVFIQRYTEKKTIDNMIPN